MSKATSGIVLFSLLMALSLGVAFGEDEAADEPVVETIADANNTTTNNTTGNNTTIETIEVDEVAEEDAE